jgi:hypothetical protein
VTPAVLDRPMFRVDKRLPDGRVTLEERLNSVLDGVRTNGSGECPICHARMARTPAGTSAGAECGGCGSVLS